MELLENKDDLNTVTKNSALPDVCCIDGQFVDLLMAYTKAIQQNPQQAQLYVSRANIFLKYEQYFYALQDANEVIRLLSKSGTGYMLKGNIYMDMEMFSEAIAVFQEGLTRSRHTSHYALEKKLSEAKSLYYQQTDDESKIPSYGLWLGFLIGLLTSVCSKLINIQLFENNGLRIILFVAPMIIFYTFALFYIHMVQRERKQLLHLPNYFFQMGENSNSESTLVNLYKKKNFNII